MQKTKSLKILNIMLSLTQPIPWRRKISVWISTPIPTYKQKDLTAMTLRQNEDVNLQGGSNSLYHLHYGGSRDEGCRRDEQANVVEQAQRNHVAYIEAFTCHSKQEVVFHVSRKWKLLQLGMFKFSADAGMLD